LIHAWAEKHGSSHEDWTLTDDFAAALDVPISVNGQPPLVLELHATTQAVIAVADRFLVAITPESIARVEGKRRTTMSAGFTKDTSTQ
jgi:hypothetical protein